MLRSRRSHPRGFCPWSSRRRGVPGCCRIPFPSGQDRGRGAGALRLLAGSQGRRRARRRTSVLCSALHAAVGIDPVVFVELGVAALESWIVDSVWKHRRDITPRMPACGAPGTRRDLLSLCAGCAPGPARRREPSLVWAPLLAVLLAWPTACRRAARLPSLARPLETWRDYVHCLLAAGERSQLDRPRRTAAAPPIYSHEHVFSTLFLPHRRLIDARKSVRNLCSGL